MLKSQPDTPSLIVAIDLFEKNLAAMRDFAAAYSNKKLYKGWSSNSSDCIATYESGRIYKGWSTNSSDCVATYSDKKLYKGWSSNSSDCILTFSTELKLTPALVMWLVYHLHNAAYFHFSVSSTERKCRPSRRHRRRFPPDRKFADGIDGIPVCAGNRMFFINCSEKIRLLLDKSLFMQFFY